METYIRKKTVLKKWTRFSILVILIVVLFVSLTLIKKSFSRPTIPTIEYSYTIEENVDYKVYLYDNSFIEDDFLGKDELYVADLVKNIVLDFNYSFSGSKIVPIRYEYDVVGTIKGKYKNTIDGGDELWTKQYILLTKQEGRITDANNINIKAPIEIDYKHYDDVVTKFRKELKISIDATFDIVMNVKIYGENDLEEQLADTKIMSVSIPLNSQVFKITNSHEPIVSKNIKSEEQINKINMKRFICGILIIVIDLIILVLLRKEIFNLKRKNNYELKLNKILKNYGDIIIEVKNPNNEEGLNIVEVKNFNEMIDLEEELRIPIIFHETYEGLEGVFSIIYSNVLYKYTLTNDEEKAI